MMNGIKFFQLALCLILSVTLTQAGFACTRVLKSDDTQAIMVGRNMDWLEDMHANLWIYPQGIARAGLATGNAVKWISKYGSIVASVYDNIQPVTTDGMNEKGLAAHLLSLSESDYGQRNETLPGLSVLLWAQYYLDNFQTVDEAVRFTETNSFQLIPFFYPKVKKWINLHLALEDASGDSAIIEYIDGTPHVYHNRAYKVLTNSPTFNQQLENLKQYQGFGGDKPLPGTTIPADRFVRATYYSAHLPPANSIPDEVAGILSVMQNVSQPFGIASPERPNISQTIWRVVADLTHRVYYFNSSTSFNIIWVQMDKLDFRMGAPVMKLDLVNHHNLVGDVSNEFKSQYPSYLHVILAQAGTH